MTALSDALEAAQRRTLTALQAALAAEKIDAEAFTIQLHACGISEVNDTEIGYLATCVAVCSQWGAALPTEPKNGTQPLPMTDNQRAGILKRCREKQLQPPDEPLTKDQAHEIISSMDAGTYDPAKWRVPF